MTVTIAATVFNESERFLRKALECWSALSDRIVIQDNMSTDHTVAVCEEFGCEIHPFETSMEGNETAVMSNLWDIATKDADWVVFVDADQCFAGDFRPHLIGNRCAFPLFDLWSPNTYRADKWWRPRPWPKAVKMTEMRDFEPIWPQRGWHCGHVPSNLHEFGPEYVVPRECGILHYAYASEDLRKRHFEGYIGRREHLTPTELFHARTIMDPSPNTPELPFEPRWTLM